MKKQIIIRATLIAAPAVAVMILALLCFDENGQTPIVEIEAPVRIVETAMPPVSALGATAEPAEDAPAVTAQPEGTNTPPVTNRLGTLTIRGQDISIANNVDEATLDKSPGWMPDSAATKSSKCNTLRKENFGGGFPTEAFARTVVDQVRHTPEMHFGKGVKIVALGEEKAKQAVGVLVGAALPWLVRLRKVDRSADGCFKLPELRKLRAVVQRDALYIHTFEHLLDCFPCFARVAAADY